MARRTQTYAIRLAVEGGGQVKAELVSVGQSAEQSLKRIETAGGKASGGLKDLGGQAELLRTGIRTLGGALAGVTTVGGLAALVNRSISAADAIGKTADKIGVGVEALQELRFAAKASGIEQQTLDMALQRFVRRTAEAAQGTGEAKDALAQMGIALRDQDGHLRRSEDLLSDVADAFARIEDPAERVRLAFKLFDSEGVALVNLLSDGSGALDQIRERARDLEGPPKQPPAPGQTPPSPDDTAGVKDRAARLQRIQEDLENTLFSITHEGSERIIAEHERRVSEIEALRAKDGSNAEQVDRLVEESAAVREAQLSALRAKEAEATDKVRATNNRVVEGLNAERAALTSTDREQFVAQALSRLSAEATAQQRREVEELAGALYDEQQALQARQRLMDEGRSVTDRARTATEQYAAGPEFATTVVVTGSGHEQRNVDWAEARGRWDVASGLKNQAQLDELIAFFRARKGKAYGFRFKDWTDYQATGQLIGTGNGALKTFQLAKRYLSGSVIEVRTVTKPVAGTVRVYLDGVEQLAGWSVDVTTGIVTFATAPVSSVAITADFELDVPVRFDTDHMAVTIESFRLHRWQQIPIVELRG
jgi:uncharacterized protein (TIGR02217 family)